VHCAGRHANPNLTPHPLRLPLSLHNVPTDVKNYMLDELADEIVNSGHNVVATVYMQSTSAGWLLAAAPASDPSDPSDATGAFRCVGECEVMQGIAAQAESGRFGLARICAGIVGTVHPLPSDEAGAGQVLDAHMRSARNFRGIRLLGGRAEDLPFGTGPFMSMMAALASRKLVWDCNGPETHPLSTKHVLEGVFSTAAAFPE
jgi:hypothetical protein